MLLEYRPPLTPYLQILYQDEAIIVLNKPSGLLSVPGKAPEHQDSLQLRVQRVYPTARTVHRLDMATSGLLVMALTPEAQRSLNWQFERRQTQKHYIALLEGQLKAQTGVVDLPLICDWPNRPRQMVCFQNGKSAQTLFEKLAVEGDATRVRLTPITGRSHQLRVHMQWLGHPICGDKFYGTAPDEKTERLQLHAAMLGLNHPNTGHWLQFQAPAPF